MKNRQEKFEVKKVKNDNMSDEKKLSGPIVVNRKKLENSKVIHERKNKIFPARNSKILSERKSNKKYNSL